MSESTTNQTSTEQPTDTRTQEQKSHDTWGTPIDINKPQDRWDLLVRDAKKTVAQYETEAFLFISKFIDGKVYDVPELYMEIYSTIDKQFEFMEKQFIKHILQGGWETFKAEVFGLVEAMTISTIRKFFPGSGEILIMAYEINKLIQAAKPIVEDIIKILQLINDDPNNGWRKVQLLHLCDILRHFVVQELNVQLGLTYGPMTNQILDIYLLVLGKIVGVRLHGSLGPNEGDTLVSGIHGVSDSMDRLGAQFQSYKRRRVERVTPDETNINTIPDTPKKSFLPDFIGKRKSKETKPETLFENPYLDMSPEQLAQLPPAPTPRQYSETPPAFIPRLKNVPALDLLQRPERYEQEWAAWKRSEVPGKKRQRITPEDLMPRPSPPLPMKRTETQFFTPAQSRRSSRNNLSGYATPTPLSRASSAYFTPGLSRRSSAYFTPPMSRRVSIV